MRQIILMNLLVGVLLASGARAAVLTPEASVAESIRKAQIRIKTKETQRANALNSLVNEINSQIAVLNKEQSEKLKGVKDEKQAVAIRKLYAERIAKLKSQQGVKSKQISEVNGKELTEMKAELTALQKQQAVERKAREKDTAKLSQERAKKLKPAPSALELEKTRLNAQQAAEKQLQASKAKRVAEQEAWKKRDQGGKRLILDLDSQEAN